MNFDKLIKNVVKSNKSSNKINFKTDKIAMTRLKRQKGISKFGDFDKDGVPNIFDCNPFDKKKQADIHTQLNNMQSGYDYVPTNNLNFTNETSYDATYRKPKVIAPKTYLDSLRQEAKKEMSGLKSGLIQSSRQSVEGFKAASPITDAPKIQQQYGVSTGSGIGSAFQLSSGKGFYETLGVMPVQSLPSQPVSTQSASVPEQRTMTPQFEKVDPRIQTEPQMDTSASLSEAQASPSTRIFSPYSKRKVAFIRGPYKKRM